jgi:hypothetical protein
MTARGKESLPIGPGFGLPLKGDIYKHLHIKSEIQSTKFETNRKSEYQMIETIRYSANFKKGKAKRFLIVLNFCHLIFEFVSPNLMIGSIFEFRILIEKQSFRSGTNYLNTFKNQASICSSKSTGIRHGNIYFAIPGSMGNIVKTAVFIRIIKIDGCRGNLVTNR